ncbi:MAG: hypothetical protein GTO71_09735 [Woeseiaceae bacterium]|nr:hypothetical protein [Woeseiaceae bacterium]NIP21366.1 hypothetical protein [Woeseiaceae bacterium]
MLRDSPAWIAHLIVPVAFTLTAYRFLIGAIQHALGRDTEGDEHSLP